MPPTRAASCERSMRIAVRRAELLTPPVAVSFSGFGCPPTETDAVDE
jgi:hypothetical protein